MKNGQENIYFYDSPKPKRSLKRKLAIVFTFLLILAVTPSLIYALTNLDFEKTSKISMAELPSQTITQEDLQVIVEEPKKPTNQAEVINNDSYWKISKRVCGTGKYYLSIQTQNGNKALYEGDTVVVNCTL